MRDVLKNIFPLSACAVVDTALPQVSVTLGILGSADIYHHRAFCSGVWRIFTVSGT